MKSALSKIIVCCAVAIVTLSTITSPANANSDVVKAIVVEEGGRRVLKVVTGLFTEHTRFYPDGDVLIYPMSATQVGGTRAGWNLAHTEWVPRGSQPVMVRLTIHGVSDDAVRDRFRLMLKADKGGRSDKDRRPHTVGHNDFFELKYGTGGDRAYYFVLRDSGAPKEVIPEGAYIKLEIVR